MDHSAHARDHRRSVPAGYRHCSDLVVGLVYEVYRLDDGEITGHWAGFGGGIIDFGVTSDGQRIVTMFAGRHNIRVVSDGSVLYKTCCGSSVHKWKYGCNCFGR